MEIIIKLPALFKIDSCGKIRSWEVSVCKEKGRCHIQTSHGHLDGKLQTESVEITNGTNIGKKNEKNIEENAISNAKKKWKDRKEKHQYSENAQSYIPTFTPMLAAVYDSKKVQYPCFIQPKLDGVRCSVYLENGELVAKSRTGQLFTSCNEILQELGPFFKNNPNVILDGELYSDIIPFEQLVGLVKTKSSSVECKFIYHVYDIANLQDCQNFRDRFFSCDILSQLSDLRFVTIVSTIECNTQNDIDTLSTQHKERYEGSIIRNDKPYEQKRSTHLMKLKEKLEDEFIIVGFTEGRGREKGQVIWECQTQSGDTFQCRPMGTKHSREKLLLDASEYIGSKYTVFYQELTKRGIPRFPVGKCIRNYE